MQVLSFISFPFLFQRFWVLCLFSLTSVAIAQTPQAQFTSSAQQILQEMSRAMRTLNYKGTLALFRNDRLNTMQFYHAADQGEEQERLISLNSPLLEAIRTPALVKCYYLDTKRVVVDHRPSRRSFLMDLPESFAESVNGYDFILSEPEIVARLPALVIFVKPKDSFRYARKIWISRDSFLPLRFELFDDHGRMLEQMVFTELQVVDSLPLIKIPIEKNLVQHIHQQESLDFDKAAFVLHEMPLGFKKVSFTKQHLHGSDKLVDHLLLSDGFSSISIYLEGNDNESVEKSSPGYRAVGAVNFYTDRLKNHQLTVMGEVPVKTLKYIARKIHLRKPAGAEATTTLADP